MKLTLAALLACAAGGCDQPRAAPSVASESAAPPPTQASFPEVPPPSAGASRIFPSSDVQAGWKAQLESLCAAGDVSLQRADFDVTGDGKAERICWRVVNGPPIGDYVDIVVVHDGARRQSAYLLLPANGGVQEAVCPGGPYSVTPEKWTDAEMREIYGIPSDWPKLGLTISGEECDPVQLFWPDDADKFEDNGVLFLFARL
jgi:hypothetical protein